VTAKGIGEAIQAYKILNQQDKAKLIIYGDGPESRLFNRLATDIKGIEMVGHIDKVTKALMRADVFVHPSYHEGFSLSLIEATMCSLPIIACRVGGNPEIVKEGVNGLLIKEKDPGSLANAMRYFIENPDLIKSMGRKSRDIYLENFQFNKIVKEKFLPLYEK
jgi:glycosyltransferase involved in cell wall biosynthesis